MGWWQHLQILLLLQGPASTTCGHFGFAFNYWDNNNYDFVYKSQTNNFHYGRVKDGDMSSASNPGGNPSVLPGKWHSLKIEVDANSKKVKFSMDDKVLGYFTASFSTRGYGGPLVANGFGSTVQFRNFDVAPKF